MLKDMKRLDDHISELVRFVETNPQGFDSFEMEKLLRLVESISGESDSVLRDLKSLDTTLSEIYRRLG